MIDYNKLFSIVNRRLSNIIRFNTVARNNKESVAEHSFFVSFYAMFLSDLIEGIDKEKVIKLALIHDLEESISGDIPHNVKDKYPDLNLAIEKMNLEIVKEIFQDEKEYIELWKETRRVDSKEAALMKLCDIISVLLYAEDEIKQGNTFMIPIRENYKKLFNDVVDKNHEL